MKSHESVREALHADPDGSVAEVGATRFRGGVVVHVYDLVEVVCDDFCDFVEFVEVVLAIGDEGRESDRCEIADGGFVG